MSTPLGSKLQKTVPQPPSRGDRLEHFSQSAPLRFAAAVLVGWMLAAGVATGLWVALTGDQLTTDAPQIAGRVAATVLLLFLLYRWGWLDSSGITRSGPPRVWLLAVAAVAYLSPAYVWGLFGLPGLDALRVAPDAFWQELPIGISVGIAEEFLFRGISVVRAGASVGGNPDRCLAGGPGDVVGVRAHARDARTGRRGPRLRGRQPTRHHRLGGVVGCTRACLPNRMARNCHPCPHEFRRFGCGRDGPAGESRSGRTPADRAARTAMVALRSLALDGSAALSPSPEGSRLEVGTEGAPGSHRWCRSLVLPTAARYRNLSLRACMVSA